MFFQNPKLPAELILKILAQLSLKDALSFLLVSSEMNAFIKDDSIWKKFGAKSFEDFVTRMKALPDNFRRYILKEQYKYTLAFAEDIVRIQKLPYDQQKQELFTEAQLAAMPFGYHIIIIQSNFGIQAWREGVLTAEQAATMLAPYILELLTDEQGVQALRKSLITPAPDAGMVGETTQVNSEDNFAKQEQTAKPAKRL